MVSYRYGDLSLIHIQHCIASTECITSLLITRHRIAKQKMRVLVLPTLQRCHTCVWQSLHQRHACAISGRRSSHALYTLHACYIWHRSSLLKKGLRQGRHRLRVLVRLASPDQSELLIDCHDTFGWQCLLLHKCDSISLGSILEIKLSSKFVCGSSNTGFVFNCQGFNRHRENLSD